MIGRPVQLMNLLAEWYNLFPWVSTGRVLIDISSRLSFLCGLHYAMRDGRDHGRHLGSVKWVSNCTWVSMHLQLYTP